MRIALATSSYFPHVGGVEEHVRNVARVLMARGHDVVIWTVARDGVLSTDLVDGVEVRSLPAPLPARSSRSVAHFARRFPSAARQWRDAARAFQPDVVHIQCFGPNGTYARLAARSSIPVVLSTHGETLADDTVVGKSRFASWSLRRGLQHAAAVTACSLVTLNDLRSRFGLPDDAGTVVYNGIDMDDGIATTVSGSTEHVPPPMLVAAVGRIEPVKGFDLLLEAFARAPIPRDATLVIGGDGSMLPMLQARAAELGVANRVDFRGWLDGPAVAELLREATVGVVPSRFEAFGIAVLEMWRAGLPVVATTRGGPPEYVKAGRDGLLVDPENIDGLASAIGRILANPALASELGRAGSRRAAEFPWERTVADYEEVYEHAAAIRSRPMTHEDR